MPWLIAAHRGPTLAMVAVATTLAAVVGAPVLLTLVAVLAGQLSVGWQNDLLDRHRDAVVGRAEKPLVSGQITPDALMWAWVVATLVAATISFPAFGTRGGWAHVVAVVSAWSYNIWLKRTLLSFLPYLISFALLPLAIMLGAGKQAPVWLVVVGGGLGILIHFINVWPDVDHDLATGVQGLPQRLVAFARDSSSTADRSTWPRFAQRLRRRK